MLIIKNVYDFGARWLYTGKLSDKPVAARIYATSIGFQVKFYAAYDAVSWYTKDYETYERAMAVGYRWVSLYTVRLHEDRKQADDNSVAYFERINWDNSGRPELRARRWFERLQTNAIQEKMGYTDLPTPSEVVAYYSDYYDITDHGIPPKLSVPNYRQPTKAELDAHDVWLKDFQKQTRKENKAKDRERVAQDQAYWQDKYQMVEMTFGGSHRQNARILRAIKDAGIRTNGSNYPVTLNSKRRSIHVHVDDVEKARAIGLSVRKS